MAGTLPALPTAAGLAPQSSVSGAVVPSISSAVAWLRSCAKSRQQLRLQVGLLPLQHLHGRVLWQAQLQYLMLA